MENGLIEWLDGERMMLDVRWWMLDGERCWILDVGWLMLDFGLKKIKNLSKPQRRKERRGMIIDFRWKMASLHLFLPFLRYHLRQIEWMNGWKKHNFLLANSFWLLGAGLPAFPACISVPADRYLREAGWKHIWSSGHWSIRENWIHCNYTFFLICIW